MLVGATANNLQLHLAADGCFADEANELFGAFDAVALVLQNSVSGLEAGLLGWAAGVDASDLDAGFFL